MTWLRALLAPFRVSTPGYVCWSGHIRNSMSRREYRTWQRTKRVTCGRCDEPMFHFGLDEEASSVTTFADALAVPACRARLECFAAHQNAEAPADHQPERLARALRMLCPVDEGVTDAEVLGLFKELREDVAVRDAVAAGDVPWCSVVPEATGSDRDGQALDAAQDRVNDTLAKLIPAGGQP